MIMIMKEDLGQDQHQHPAHVVHDLTEWNVVGTSLFVIVVAVVGRQRSIVPISVVSKQQQDRCLYGSTLQVGPVVDVVDAVDPVVEAERPVRRFGSDLGDVRPDSRAQTQHFQSLTFD
jgi:hypothetical protein